ncbi:MAG: M48 family metallopeptidase [Prevotellaceae bacterium]|jgi:hypothetical protein|nr:M48 family metallopeptidase [Prevotellaceae bacterium]
MKKTLTILFLSVICAANALANSDLSNFEYLKSEGKMPEQVKEILSSNKEEFQYLRTLFESGRLVYGSELNRYVEKIADELLKKDPNLRKKLSFYIYKSSAVNAMVSDEGIVLINIGLLAQARNESELAYIIGHEIVHFTDHKKDKNHKIKITSLKEYLNHNHGSREQELEADELSLKRYFIPSGYSLQAIEGVFDVMRYGYLPFDEVPFSKSEVETNFYQFPDEYYLTAIKPIRSRADYIDTLSTHPNIQRREQILERTIEKNTDNGTAFLQGEPLFNQIRSIARFECINQDLTVHRYDRAIYNIFILKREFPNNKFLEIAEASAYYGFHKHRLNDVTDEIISDYKEVEGEMQAASHFLKQIRKKEINVLAIRKIIPVIKKYSDNKYLENIAIDAMIDLQSENEMKIEDFSDFAKDEKIDSAIYLTQNQEDKSGDKYSKIKKAAVKYVFPSEKFKTVNYMLVDLHRDETFLSIYEDALRKTEDSEVLGIAKSDKPKLEKGKLLLIEPTYRKVNRKGDNYSNSEKGAKTLFANMKRSAKAVGIDYQLSDNKEVTTTETFNELAVSGQWYIDCMSDKFNMVNYQSQWFVPQMQKSGIRYVNFVNLFSQNDKFWTEAKTQTLITIPLNIVTAPVRVLRLALPNNSQRLNFMIYDMEEVKVIFSTSYSVESTNASAYITQQLYNMYYFVKNGKK